MSTLTIIVLIGFMLTMACGGRGGSACPTQPSSLINTSGSTTNNCPVVVK